MDNMIITVFRIHDNEGNGKVVKSMLKILFIRSIKILRALVSPKGMAEIQNGHTDSGMLF